MKNKFDNFIEYATSKAFIMPLSRILECKNILMKNYNMTLEEIDNLPFWQFQEYIKIIKTTTK